MHESGLNKWIYAIAYSYGQIIRAQRQSALEDLFSDIISNSVEVGFQLINVFAVTVTDLSFILQRLFKCFELALNLRHARVCTAAVAAMSTESFLQVQTLARHILLTALVTASNSPSVTSHCAQTQWLSSSHSSPEWNGNKQMVKVIWHKTASGSTNVHPIYTVSTKKWPPKHV